MRFTDVFYSIQSPTSEDVLSAEPIYSNLLYLTRNIKGNAGLIMRMQAADPTFNPYFSEAIDIQYRKKCKIDANGEAQLFGALSIQTKIPEMEAAISIFAEIIIDQGFFKSKRQSQLFEYLNDLIQLFTFKHPDEFPLNLALGLWGELKLIETIPNLWQFWRGTEGTTFDFQDKGISLEVKTSMRGNKFTIMSKQLAPISISSFLLAYDVDVDYDQGQSVTELVFSVLRKIPPEDAFSLSKTLASRGFVFGTKENNLLKPFKHSADSPICINLNKIEPSFATLLESIADKIEHDRFNKVKFSFNSGQLLQLSNMNLECVRQTMEAVICQE